VANSTAGPLITYTSMGTFPIENYKADKLNNGDVGTGVASNGLYAIPQEGDLVLFFGTTQTLGSIAIHNGYTNRDDGSYTLKDGSGNVLGSWTVSTPNNNGSNDGAHSFWLNFKAPIVTDRLIITCDSFDFGGTTSYREIQIFGGAPSTTSGMLTFSDVDNGAKAAWSGSKVGTYGSFDITSDGKWYYTLDNSSGSDADKLNTGDSKTETFTATVTDNLGATASQLVTVTVLGTTDLWV
jgi:VCBS repeat-containing protein